MPAELSRTWRPAKNILDRITYKDYKYYFSDCLVSIKVLENKNSETYKIEGLAYIVGCRGALQLGGSLLGIPPGYKANKLKESLSYPLGIIRTLVWRKENTLYRWKDH